MMTSHRRDIVLGLAGAAALAPLPAMSQSAGSGAATTTAQNSSVSPSTGTKQTQSSEPRSTKKIGLIGGLALRAGVFYYEQLLQRYNARGETLELLLSHADVKKVLTFVGAGDKAGLGRYLGTLSNELFDAGASLVAVTAVAPHLAIKEISQSARGPVVNVLDSIVDGLQAAGVKRVAVFGNRAVIQTDIFGALPKEMVVKLEPSVLESVHSMYNDIALHGKRGTRPETEYLSKVAHELIEKGGAQAIVLAGTDLSSFYAEQRPDYPSVDVAQLHIDQIMKA
jgi:aspartate/glutamate racemase